MERVKGIEPSFIHHFEPPVRAFQKNDVPVWKKADEGRRSRRSNAQAQEHVEAG
jgi:hypothetical protein